MGLFCDLDSVDCKGNGRSLGKRHFYLAQLADDLFGRVLPGSHISPFFDSETLTLELDRFLGGRSLALYLGDLRRYAGRAKKIRKLGDRYPVCLERPIARIRSAQKRHEGAGQLIDIAGN